MPSEAAITRMQDVLFDVIDLGGIEERTSIVPNLTVIDAAPTGLANFIIVQDERDGDNILASTVPGVVYANNDKVNVLFIRGTEPIAFQQGSESTSANLWQIVPATSTDIYYNSGNVGIGKSVAPNATLEILDTTTQLRLTHTEDSKYATFTLDTNHDLTVTPTSTGQVIFQPTTDSLDFFQVLDADGGDPVLNVDSTNERIGIGTDTPDSAIHISQAAAAVQLNFQNTGDTTAIRRATLNFSHANGNAARIQGRRESGDSDGMSMRLFTEPVGGAITERMRIEDTGEISIGSFPGSVAQLFVDQPSTTAAIPVLYLDQADISEEMIEFNTTIGTGNAIEAVGGKSLTVTHFIKVTLPGALTRYIEVGTIA